MSGSVGVRSARGAVALRLVSLLLLSSAVLVVPADGVSAQSAAKDDGVVFSASAEIDAEHVLDVPLGTPTNGGFGSAVAAEGDFAVVGAPRDDVSGEDAGAVFVFTRASASDPWQMVWRLEPGDLEPGDQFGSSVDVDGQNFVVGAPFARGGIGRVYVFTYDGVEDEYSMLSYSPPDGEPGDFFGHSVAISEDAVVVGAPFDSLDAPASGSVSLLSVGASALTRDMQWSGFTANGRFGWSVDIDHDSLMDIAIGQPNGGPFGAGALHVYSDDVSQITVNDAGAGWVDLGFSVAIDSTSDIVVVGDPGAGSAGRVAFFSDSGQVLLETLEPSDPIAGFGYDVDIKGPAAVIGAPWSYNNAGRVFGWVWSMGSSFLREAAPEATGALEVGKSVAIGGALFTDDLYAGAPSPGAENAVVLGFDVTTFQHVPLSLLADASPPAITPSDVAIEDDAAVVGVPDYPSWWGHDSGAAFAYGRGESGWELIGRLGHDHGVENFGQVVAIDADRVVVGAPAEQSGVAGGVFAYEVNGQDLQLLPAAVMSSGQTDDGFGASVAAAQGRIAVGAPTASTAPETQDGKVYVYAPAGPVSSGQVLSPAQVLEGDGDFASFGTAVTLDASRMAASAVDIVGDLVPAGPISVGVYRWNGSQFVDQASVPLPFDTDGFGFDLDFGSNSLIVPNHDDSVHVYGDPEGVGAGPSLLEIVVPGPTAGHAGAADGDAIVVAAPGHQLVLSLTNGSDFELGGALTTGATLSGHSVDLSCSDVIATTATGAVVVEAQTNPVAMASGPYSGVEGGTVALDGSDSMVFGCDATYSWVVSGVAASGFGGRTVQVGLDGVGGPATLNATLTVIDDNGAVGVSDPATISVANTPPSLVGAGITGAGGAPPTAGQAVTLSLGAGDPGGDAVTYQIDWGDGSFSTAATATATSASHTYEFPGTYSITVTATDQDGGTTSTVLTVDVDERDVSGYWMLGVGGQVHRFGSASEESVVDPAGATAVDIEAAKSGSGFWILDDAGVIHARGDADHFGNVDVGLLAAGERPVSLSATPHGDGYWVFTTRGRALAFGAAQFHGDVSHLDLRDPVIDSVATPTGGGYYMVALDGGVFALGDAQFAGSTGALSLDAPVRTLVPDPDGAGYWLFAEDGGVFAFGAPFVGSIPGVLPGVPLNRPIASGISFGDGYLLVAYDGGIFNFSSRQFYGSTGDNPPTYDIIGVAASRV